MNNFRSTHDEFVDIEKRWSLLSSREAILAKRERDVRVKEEEIRKLMKAMPIQMPIPQAPHRPQREHHKQKAFRKKQHNDKDYSQFAVKPNKKREILTNNNIDTDIREFQSS